jgi:hypothetical protein
MALRAGFEDGQLDGGERFIALPREGGGEGRMDGDFCFGHRRCFTQNCGG